MGATHAITKIYQKFKNRIPRELDVTFDFLRICMIQMILHMFMCIHKALVSLDEVIHLKLNLKYLE